MNTIDKLQDTELKKMLMELSNMLQEVYRDKLRAVVLYGSTARGTGTDDSDIDIMVLINGTDQEYITWMQISPFYKNISDEGLVIWNAC